MQHPACFCACRVDVLHFHLPSDLHGHFDPLRALQVERTLLLGSSGEQSDNIQVHARVSSHRNVLDGQECHGAWMTCHGLTVQSHNRWPVVLCALTQKAPLLILLMGNPSGCGVSAVSSATNRRSSSRACSGARAAGGSWTPATAWRLSNRRPAAAARRCEDCGADWRRLMTQQYSLQLCCLVSSRRITKAELSVCTHREHHRHKRTTDVVGIRHEACNLRWGDTMLCATLLH